MGHGPIKREILLAKSEVTYGTDSTPTGSADAVLVENIAFAPDRLRLVRRPSVSTSLGELQQIYAGSLVSLNFACEVKGSGTAGTAPEIGPLLKACGLSETVVASTSVTYAPSSSSHGSVAMYYFEAAAGGNSGVRHIALGCRGNVELVWEAGGKPMANFSFIGKRSSAPTDQNFPTATYDTVVPVGIRGMATTIGGVSGLTIQRYALNLNNEIQIPDSITDSEGFGEVTIIGRDPVLDLGRHNELVATVAPWADMVAGTTRAFASGTLGSTAGNRIALTAGRMYYRNVQPGDDNGFRTGTYPFGLAESSALNDEFSLVFT